MGPNHFSLSPSLLTGYVDYVKSPPNVNDDSNFRLLTEFTSKLEEETKQVLDRTREKIVKEKVHSEYLNDDIRLQKDEKPDLISVLKGLARRRKIIDEALSSVTQAFKTLVGERDEFKGLFSTSFATSVHPPKEGTPSQLSSGEVIAEVENQDSDKNAEEIGRIEANKDYLEPADLRLLARAQEIY